MTTRAGFSLAVLVAVVASLLVLPTTAPAFKVFSGSAEIRLRPPFQQSLAAKGVTVSPTGDASRTGNRLVFPIRRGSVKPKRQRARLRGGLSWSAPSPRATGANAKTNKLKLVARKRGGRIESIFSSAQPRGALFKLSKVRFRRQGRPLTASVTLMTARVSLARAGARELNQALQLGGTLSFRPGERVGPLTLCLGLDPNEPHC